MPSKICIKCGAKCGVRTKECSCGQPFHVKTKKAVKHKLAAIDWKELKKGDTIKSISSHGPWRPSQDGTTIYMGEYGIIKVDKLDDKGIHGYNQDGSHCYLYMGEDFVSKTGTNMSAHKIKKTA